MATVLMKTELTHEGSRPEDGVRDMIIISDIDENGINTNLKTRYKKDQIYTFTGSILVAVNPYKGIKVYEQTDVEQYQGRKLSLVEPHIFAIAEAAFQSLNSFHTNQSCIISGESGAGKTESTKFILQYLCSVTHHTSFWKEQQILEANTVLEAFGNAKTVRNDNSSRFGKFMQVCFDDACQIKGCIIQDYLLEQSRITFQSPNERNYHVFYQLAASAQASEELAMELGLGPVDSYAYLNQSGCYTLDGVDDATMFNNLRLAMNVINIPEAMVNGIFSVLSAILLLGNLQFADVEGEKSELTQADMELVERVCHLLGFDQEMFVEALLFRQIQVRGTVTSIPYKFAEALENRHAMAKALYSRTFAWLVDAINDCTNPDSHQQHFIGILDIFGFENFKTNSFEQLCINYTNEKLHRFFNHYVFALEQQAYKEEDIQFDHITFTDNSKCVELIEKPPRCVLKVLDEECRFPQGSDKSYLLKQHEAFEQHPYYIKGADRRTWETVFGIHHYAGAVTYTAAGFLDKNKDTQQDQLFELMHAAQNALVKDLTRFRDLLGVRLEGLDGRQTISKTARCKPTVGDTFKHQLSALVDVLEQTNPWYVRCLKPNNSKKANLYVEEEVITQLSYSGMLDIIRIKREGYPVHIDKALFVDKYSLLLEHDVSDAEVATKEVLTKLNLPVSDWQIGRTKVFMRSSVFESLEDQRMIIINVKVTLIQRIWRGFRAHRDYLRMKEAVVIVQTNFRCFRHRLHYLKKKRAAVVLQKHYRGRLARLLATWLREERLREEEQRRQEEEERLKLELEREAAERAALEEEERRALEEAERAECDSLEDVIAETGEECQQQLETLTTMIESMWIHYQPPVSPHSLDLDTMFNFLLEDRLEHGQLVKEKQRALDAINEEFQGLDALLDGSEAPQSPTEHEVERVLQEVDDSIAPFDGEVIPTAPDAAAPPISPPPSAMGTPVPPPAPPLPSDMPAPRPLSGQPVATPLPAGGPPPPPPPPIPGAPTASSVSDTALPCPPPCPPLPPCPPPPPIPGNAPSPSFALGSAPPPPLMPESAPPPPLTPESAPPPPPLPPDSMPLPPSILSESLSPPSLPPPTIGEDSLPPPPSVMEGETSTINGYLPPPPPPTLPLPPLPVENPYAETVPLSAPGGPPLPVSEESPYSTIPCQNELPSPVLRISRQRGSTRGERPPPPPRISAQLSAAAMAQRHSREQTLSLSPTLQRQIAVLSQPAPGDLPSPSAPPTLNGQMGITEGEDIAYDMLEYAEKHFNQHERDAGGTIMKSLKKRRQSLNDVLSKAEMLRYCKSGLIPTSHVHLHDLENIHLACSLFKEMTRYLRDELREDGGLVTVQYIVRSGIERIELRDEIFCQLVRQTTDNPDSEGLTNAWILLALCTAAFAPSKTLHKYLLSYIKKNCSDPVVGKLALMCHTHLTVPRATARRYPPSATEVMVSGLKLDLFDFMQYFHTDIKCAKALCPVICKVYFMDGKTKAIHVQSIDTTVDVMKKVARKIGLKSIEGWAIYEVTKVYERFVRSYEYVTDILAQWEQQDHLSSTSGKVDTVSKKGPKVTMGSEDAKLMFRKRVYRHVHDIPNDPMEYHLLYAEAVHKVVRSDEFSVSEKVALQLAGLQAQVIWGNFEGDKVFRYSEAEQYLCKRILASSGRNWSQEVAKAHQHYGSGKSELEAKVWYLTCVKQFPLYGCTLFPIVHKGLWSHTHDALLAINMDGVKFLRAKDKSIIHDFRYSDIETIAIDANENYITLELRNTAQSQCQQKSFMFATIHKEDIGHLIASYSPHHATWMKPESEGMKKMKMSDEEKLKLYEELVRSRKALSESRLLQRPQHDTNSGFFRNTLRRLTKTKMDKLRSSAAGDCGMFGVDYWSYSKSSLRQSLTVIPDPSIEETAVKMFTSILIYTGVEEAGKILSACFQVYMHAFRDIAFGEKSAGQTGEVLDSSELVQALMQKCLNNDHLCNEFYLQLIKQTTDHPDPNSLVNKRSWQLLAVAACTLSPVNSRVLKYLQVHLKKCSMDNSTEEGMFARYCHKCLLKTLEKRRRKFPPSNKEIQCIISRRAITEKVYLLTGEHRIIEFDSAATCTEVIKTVKAKIGMRSDAECFSIYEVVGGTERSMLPDERLSDTLSKWERLSRSGASREVRLVFKKHLFLEPYINSNDPVECDLIFHQLMEDVFEHRLPITHQDAIHLCAYKVQTEIEDMKLGDIDYNSVLRILPRAVRPGVRMEEVAAVHKSLLELSPHQAVLGFLSVLQAWPLFGAAVFLVSQSYTNMLPKNLLLAVGQTGLHLLDINTFSVITHHHFSEIVYFSPANKSIKSIMIVVGHVAKGTKFMFNTNQAYQIAHLIKDYVEELQARFLLMPSDQANRMSRALDLDVDLPPPPPALIPGPPMQSVTVQM